MPIDNKYKDIARSPAAQESVSHVVFSFDSEKFEGISDSMKQKWATLYPGVDIDRELLAMEVWCAANPSKAKKKKLWTKFITVWLSKTFNEKMNKEAYQQRNQKFASAANFDENRELLKKAMEELSSDSVELRDTGLEALFVMKRSNGTDHAIKFKEATFKAEFEHCLRKWHFEKKETPQITPELVDQRRSGAYAFFGIHTSEKYIAKPSNEGVSFYDQEKKLNFFPYSSASFIPDMKHAVTQYRFAR